MLTVNPLFFTTREKDIGIRYSKYPVLDWREPNVVPVPNVAPFFNFPEVSYPANPTTGISLYSLSIQVYYRHR
jgi:hypothetical protein